METESRGDEAAKAFLRTPLKLLIDGQWCEARSGRTFPFEDPSSGEVIGRAAAGDAGDIDLAVQAARAALESRPWGAMPAGERARLMNKLAALIERHADEIAVLESLNGGNPLRMIRHGEINGAIARLQYNAGWATKIFGETLLTPPASSVMAYSIRQPVGVVGAITPWNAPFYMAVGKLALALAAGCTVVLKPAELTPATAIRLGELILEAGFPRGVVNIVTGFGAEAGQALVDHRDVDKIAFTGSTATGQSILCAAAKTMKRVTLELGGKSPVVIFRDADVVTAARAAAGAAIFKSGQFCAAGTRIFADRAILPQVIEEMANVLRAAKIGPGLDAGTDIGPLISAKQRDRVVRLTNHESSGAQIVRCGEVSDGPGYFLAPALLVGAPPAAGVMREEIFGPVLCVSGFAADAGLEPIIAMANDTVYGLGARVWTRDLETAHRMIFKIKAGSVSINGGGGAGSEGLPFGGYKQSGVGREGGRAGVESYTEIKTVSIGF